MHDAGVIQLAIDKSLLWVKNKVGLQSADGGHNEVEYRFLLNTLHSKENAIFYYAKQPEHYEYNIVTCEECFTDNIRIRLYSDTTSERITKEKRGMHVLTQKPYCYVSHSIERRAETTTDPELLEKHTIVRHQFINTVGNYLIDISNHHLEIEVNYTTNWALLKNELYSIYNFLNTVFHGDMPHALRKINTITQIRNDYYISQKFDGLRVSINAFKNSAILIVMNRAQKIVNLLKLANESTSTFALDAEYLTSSEEFVIFDCTHINYHRHIQQQSLDDRQMMVRHLIQKLTLADSPYSFSPKQYYALRKIRSMLQEASPERPCDGFIFTPRYNEANKKIYKWKSADQHTIDFRLLLNVDRTYSLYYQGDKHEEPLLNSTVDVPFALDSNIIAECKCVAKDKFIYVRQRFDKTKPNHHAVVKDALYCFTHPITIQKLIFECEQE